MTPLQLALVASVTVWALVLTIVVVLVVRQIALLTARLDAAPVHEMDSMGPEIGMTVGPEATAALPRLAEARSTFVVFLSATCVPCREVAPALADGAWNDDVIVIVSGARELAASLIDSLPRDFSTVGDPTATETASALQMQSAPFAIHVQDGVVRGRTYLHDGSELAHLAEAGVEGSHGLRVVEKRGGTHEITG